jgi:hypothetical protein
MDKYPLTIVLVVVLVLEQVLSVVALGRFRGDCIDLR